MSITSDHASVQTIITGRSCRNSMEFRREEILFFHSVFFFQQIKDIILGFVIFSRDVTDCDIQVFALDDFTCFLGKLVSGKMDEKIGDTDNGIVFVFADRDLKRGSVFLIDNAVDGKRNGYILIFLDPTIIMCFEKGKSAFFV